MDEQQSRSKLLLAQLFSRWDQHDSDYDGVLYRVAFVKSGDTWQVAAAMFLPRQKGHTNDDVNRADYGDLLIVRGCLSSTDARFALEGIIDRNVLDLPGCPSVPLTAGLDAHTIRRRGSQDRRFPLPYAAYEYTFQTRDDCRVNMSNGFVCAAGLPLYPHALAAIEHQLGIRIPNPGTPEIVALTPDYRARVRRVRLSLKGATVEIETPQGGCANILGKVYHENANGRTHADLAFENGVASFDAQGYPRKMMVVLIDRDRGDNIDEWHYDADHGFHGFGLPPYSGVEFEESEENLENLIRGGESQTLEFKRQRPAKFDIARAITALANTDGGKLLIGVTDEGEVVGCELGDFPDWLTNVLRAYCEQAPTFKIVAVAIRDTRIVVINVPEGRSKPYLVKDHGPFVRVGATTRIANGYEMQELFASQPNRPWS